MYQLTRIISFLFLAISSTCISQFIEIPDSNFKKSLIDFGVDTNLDKEISVSEAEAIDSLVVSKYEIKKLKGIKSFVNLHYLNCEDNLIDSLDLSFNTKLINLDFSTNKLKEIDLSANSKLQHIRAQNDYDLESINLTNCPDLISFESTSNDLTALDLTKNTKLEKLDVSIRDVPNLNLTNNKELKYLSIIYAYLITELDLSQNTKLENATVWLTRKLDTIDFRPCPLLKTIFMTNNDNISYLNLANSNNLGYIYISQSNKLKTLDLTPCKNLTSLTCSYNKIEFLDFSKSRRLKSIRCASNQLTELDLSNLDSLTELYCSYNDLDKLDLSFNPLLSRLECANNNLEILNFTNNQKINYLYCSDNKITEFINLNTSLLSRLSCSNNLLKNIKIDKKGYFSTLNCADNKLESLNISNVNTLYLNSFDATGNENLYCIQVNDSAGAATKWTKIDTQSYFSENCNLITHEKNRSNTIEYDIYPNPTTGTLYLSNELINAEYRVMDSQGKIIIGSTLKTNNLDLSSLNSGIYILVVNGKDKTFQKQIVLK